MTCPITVRIEVEPLPGPNFGPDCQGVVLGVQERKVADFVVSASQRTAVFEVPVTLIKAPSPDWRGPHVQGRPGERFIYLVWGAGDPPEMFRRAKLMLADVPGAVTGRLEDGATLTARLSGVGRDGCPLCAAVRPPAITWTA